MNEFSEISNTKIELLKMYLEKWKKIRSNYLSVNSNFGFYTKMVSVFCIIFESIRHKYFDDEMYF